ncbi:MAG: (5-formylfuran-3-yl)methyl phosphate synthase [Isosphaeraceae bacterium]|nr:(5-formylfuran-3-yl)methyl phosphate synthase [Isosphaeraceae bacterium]
MTRLLVSVRSPAEAREAIAGGADLIDIKEPDRGPLGRADRDVWTAVLAEVAGVRPVSVALGEAIDLDPIETRVPAGIAYRKLGLAGTGRDGLALRDRLREGAGSTPWIDVVYTDLAADSAPSLERIVAAALASPETAGVLFDTFDKSRPTSLDLGIEPVVRRIRESGRIVALAGGLDAATIERLAPLRPDYFAVRTAVCRGGRTGRVDRELTAGIARLIAESSASHCL